MSPRSLDKEILRVKSWKVARILQDAECDKQIADAKAFEVARRILASDDNDVQVLGPDSEDEIEKKVIRQQEANLLSSSESESESSEEEGGAENEDVSLREWHRKLTLQQIRDLAQGDDSSSSELEDIFSDEEEGTEVA